MVRCATFVLALIHIITPLLTAQNMKIQSLPRPLIIAHRGGAALAPENTMAAFRNALTLGCDALELDIRLTSDGRPAVIHDATVNRTTDGSGTVGKMRMEQLKAFSAGKKFGSSFENEKIPDLAEVLELTDGKAHIFIEIKPAVNNSRAVVSAVTGALAMYNFRDRIVIQSFSEEIIDEVQKADPSLETAMLYFAKPRGWKKKNYFEYWPVPGKCSYINVNYRFASRRFVKRMHSLGKKVCVWTADNPRALKRMIRNGVDGIITNHPDRLMKLLNEGN